MKLPAYLLIITFAAALVVACTSPGSQTTGPTTFLSYPANQRFPENRVRHHSAAGVITKVFVIVQENRTVDNLFNGLPNANTQSYGIFKNTKITLTPVDLATPLDLGHSLKDFSRDTGCPDIPTISGGSVSFSCPMNMFQTAAPSSYVPNAYQYVKKTDTQPYWDMAEQYAFGDNMFQSNLDGSYVAHQYLVAAQANSTTDFPVPSPCKGSMATPKAQWVTDLRQYGKNPKYVTACQTYPTVIVNELQKKGKAWRYYTASSGSGFAYWDPFFWIISSYYGYYNANGNIVSPPCKFLTAMSPSASATYAPSVTWITPSSADSDHAAVTQNRYGPDWVTAVVNAIGQSRYWKNSVIFITWDDWGGWYDHVQPLYEDYDGTGIRVPFIIISPYTKAGVVTHTQYEQASILRYIEDLYGLKTMAASDARAADPADDGKIWNLSATPRPFATISPYPQGYNCNAEGSPDDG